jgi:hypothetical protein
MNFTDKKLYLLPFILLLCGFLPAAFIKAQKRTTPAVTSKENVQGIDTSMIYINILESTPCIYIGDVALSSWDEGEKTDTTFSYLVFKGDGRVFISEGSTQLPDEENICKVKGQWWSYEIKGNVLRLKASISKVIFIYYGVSTNEGVCFYTENFKTRKGIAHHRIDWQFAKSSVKACSR